MNNRIVSMGVIAALGLGLATSAHADEDRGAYLGAGVGQFNVKVDGLDDVDPLFDNYDSDDTAYKVFGGWRMTRNFAFELAYVNLGSPDEDIAPGVNFKTETDGFAPYVVGTIPLGIFEIYAKAGYFWYDVEQSLRTPAGTIRDSESNEAFTWAVGAGVTLIEHLNVRLEYEQFDIDELDDSNALWLTAAWRF